MAFAAVELFALVLWLAIGRREWFFHDDWDPLATRKAGDLGDLFGPHNGHWITLPVVMYRILYRVFGLRAYLPYRVVVLVLYLFAAGLLLVVMRRARIQPWIATAAASLFALFGTGWANLMRPFQVTFVGSLALGLLSLILVDHDGAFDRRDWLAMLAGLLALMTSGIAVVMVMAIGLAVLLRRGLPPAAAHVAPLAAVYVVWVLAIGHEGGVTRNTSPGDVVRFVARGLRGAFGALGPFSWFGVVLVVVLVVGCCFAVTQRRQSGQLASLAVPIALLAGSILFLALSATSGRRNTASSDALQSRYVSLVVAMTLPAIAVAADALARRWRWLLPIAIAVFLVGIPHNVQAARTAQRPLNAIYATTKRVVSTLAGDPQTRRAPRGLHPEQTAARQMTVGWLVDAASHHRVPVKRRLTRSDLASDRFRLSFYQRDAPGPRTRCSTLVRPRVVRLRKGQVVGVSDGTLLLTPATPLYLNPGLVFDPPDGASVEVLRAAGPVRLGPYLDNPPPRICIG